MCHKILFLKNLDRLTYSCTCQRISAVSSSVITWLQRMLCHFFRHGKCSHRNSVSDCFCHRHNIRSDTIRLPCEHGTGSSHTTLHFVTNHQNSFFIAKFADPFHKFLCSQIDAAFSLKRLQDNRTCFVCYQCFYTVQIIIFCK